MKLLQYQEDKLYDYLYDYKVLKYNFLNNFKDYLEKKYPEIENNTSKIDEIIDAYIHLVKNYGITDFDKLTDYVNRTELRDKLIHKLDIDIVLADKISFLVPKELEIMKIDMSNIFDAKPEELSILQEKFFEIVQKNVNFVKEIQTLKEEGKLQEFADKSGIKELDRAKTEKRTISELLNIYSSYGEATWEIYEAIDYNNDLFDRVATKLNYEDIQEIKNDYYEIEEPPIHYDEGNIYKYLNDLQFCEKIKNYMNYINDNKYISYNDFAKEQYKLDMKTYKNLYEICKSNPYQYDLFLNVTKIPNRNNLPFIEQQAKYALKLNTKSEFVKELDDYIQYIYNYGRTDFENFQPMYERQQELKKFEDFENEK